MADAVRSFKMASAAAMRMGSDGAAVLRDFTSVSNRSSSSCSFAVGGSGCFGPLSSRLFRRLRMEMGKGRIFFCESLEFSPKRLGGVIDLDLDFFIPNIFFSRLLLLDDEDDAFLTIVVPSASPVGWSILLSTSARALAVALVVFGTFILLVSRVLALLPDVLMGDLLLLLVLLADEKSLPKPVRFPDRCEDDCD